MHPNTTALSRRDALRFLGLAGAAAFLPSLATRAAADTPASSVGTESLPVLAGEQAGYFRFKIGAFDAVALDDGGFGGPLDQAPWPTADQAKLARDLAGAFLPSNSFSLPFNVLLVRMGSELVLVDTGCGALYGPTNGKLVKRLAAIGVKPSQITAVFLTHAHGDHFGGLLDAETKAPVFTNAQHFINRREFEVWTGATNDLASSGVSADSIGQAQSVLNALKPKWQFVAPGDKLLGGLEIIDAPGHTPGHIALQFSSGNAQLLHFVDIVHHHAISFANPEVPIRFDVQPQVAVATRKRMLDRAAADRTRLFGAHMPFPALGYVRKIADHYEHVIEPAPAV
jgi:glyoxylase-like metal-dependent hydrolase (beta-lactamase superfamily II)